MNSLQGRCDEVGYPQGTRRQEVRIRKYADFLLVDKDVLACPADEIHAARPQATYFEGNRFFSA